MTHPLNEIFPLSGIDDNPFRLRVQKSLSAALGQITLANGFGYDMVDTTGVTDDPPVFRGRQLFGAGDPLPMISILEEPLTEETDLAPAQSGSREADYDLMVQVFVPDDAENPTDNAHWALSAVRKRLLQLRTDKDHRDRLFRLGRKDNTVLDISMGGGVVRPADQVSATAYGWMRVSFQIVETD